MLYILPIDGNTMKQTTNSWLDMAADAGDVGQLKSLIYLIVEH
jgi:hypothetical protein